MSDLPGPLEPQGSFDNWMMVNGMYVFAGFLTLFGAGVFMGGILSIQDALRAKWVAKNMYAFPSVIGEVLASSLSYTITKGGSKLYCPSIEYSYVVNGKSYRSVNILPGEFCQSYDEAWARGWVTDYPVGRHMEVYYNPKKPEICVVEREGAHVQMEVAGNIALGIFLIVMALGILWAVFFKILPEGGT